MIEFYFQDSILSRMKYSICFLFKKLCQLFNIDPRTCELRFSCLSFSTDLNHFFASFSGLNPISELLDYSLFSAEFLGVLSFLKIITISSFVNLYNSFKYLVFKSQYDSRVIGIPKKDHKKHLLQLLLLNIASLKSVKFFGFKKYCKVIEIYCSGIDLFRGIPNYGSGSVGIWQMSGRPLKCYVVTACHENENFAVFIFSQNNLMSE